jgi:hypothetical protein
MRATTQELKEAFATALTPAISEITSKLAESMKSFLENEDAMNTVTSV